MSNEPVAWMYPDDLERFQISETFAQAYSIKVVSPLAGETVPLYTKDDTALLRQALEALELNLGYGPEKTIEQTHSAITALRERLGEKA